MIYVSLDIETTGLNPKLHDIIEFAAVMDNLKDPKPVSELPRFQCYLKKDHYVGDAYALGMHAEIFKKIAKSEGKILQNDELPAFFQDWLRENKYPYDYAKYKYRLTVAGKNAASFDIPFLKEKVKDWLEIDFLHRVLDPTLLFTKRDDDFLPDSKTCMERAGFSGEVKHTALDDALMVVKLIRTGFGLGC